MVKRDTYWHNCLGVICAGLTIRLHKSRSLRSSTVQSHASALLGAGICFHDLDSNPSVCSANPELFGQSGFPDVVYALSGVWAAGGGVHIISEARLLEESMHLRRP